MASRMWSRIKHGAAIGLAAFLALSGMASAADMVGSPQILRDAIKSRHILEGQVKSDDIADAQVRGADIKNRQVAARDIAKWAVKYSRLAPNSVDSTKILDTSITGIDLGANVLSGREVNEARLDFNVLQRRLQGGCDAGQAIRSIDRSGEPNCVAASGALSGLAGGDLTGSYPDPTIAAGVVGTDQIKSDAVTAAKVAANELTGSDILESTLSGVNADTLGGTTAANFLTNSSVPGGDLGGTFSNFDIAAGAVDASELASSTSTDSARAVTSDHIRDSAITTAKVAADAITAAKVPANELTGGDILESSLSGVNADTLGSTAAANFITNSTTAGGDLGGTFSSFDIAANAVDASELSSSASNDALRAVGTDHIKADAVTSAKVGANELTGSDIADTSSLGTAEVNESNLNVVQDADAGQVLRVATAPGTPAAGTNVLTLPGLGDIEVNTCTPNANDLLKQASLGFDNSNDGDTVLLWSDSSLLSTQLSVGASVPDLGSATVGLLNANELVDVYLFRPSDATSARVTIGENTTGTTCRFVVQALTS